MGSPSSGARGGRSACQSPWLLLSLPPFSPHPPPTTFPLSASHVWPPFASSTSAGRDRARLALGPAGDRRTRDARDALPTLPQGRRPEGLWPRQQGARDPNRCASSLVLAHARASCSSPGGSPALSHRLASSGRKSRRGSSRHRPRATATKELTSPSPSLDLPARQPTSQTPQSSRSLRSRSAASIMASLASTRHPSTASQPLSPGTRRRRPRSRRRTRASGRW